MPTSCARRKRLSCVLGYERTFEGVAEKEITRRKTPATRYLELQHLEASCTAIHRDTPVLRLYSSDLGRDGDLVQNRGTPDLDRPIDVGMECLRPYVGGEGPDLVVNLPDFSSPSYDPIFIRNLRSISSIRAVLFDKGQGVRLQKIQTFYYSFSSCMGQKVCEFARVHFGWYGDGALECDRACIQALVHTDDGYAGFGLPVQDCTFHGGCAAIFR